MKTLEEAINIVLLPPDDLLRANINDLKQDLELVVRPGGSAAKMMAQTAIQHEIIRATCCQTCARMGDILTGIVIGQLMHGVSLTLTEVPK